MEARVLRRELAAVSLTLLAVFLAGALIFQRVPDGGECLSARGAFGPAGTYARCALVSAVGIPGAALVAFGLLIVALNLFGHRRSEEDDVREWGVLFAGVVALVPIAIGLALGGDPTTWSARGLWGSIASHYLRQVFGAAGAWIFFMLATSALTVATLRWNPIRMLLGPRLHAPQARDIGSGVSLDDAPRSTARATLAERLAPAPEELPAIDPSLARDALRDAQFTTADAGATGRESARALSAEGIEKKAKKTRDAVVEHAMDASSDVAYSDELPTTDLLTPAPARNSDTGRRELDIAGEKLMSTLRTFKVEGTLVGRTTGPTVTQFEIEPAAGIKVRQIAALADDLALAMRAPSIRIVAPIPGRGAVGVEVPNPSPEMVVLREVLESREFQGARAALPIALGKDLEGNSVVADLAKMPHLLIAGATGSGKSVCVNTIITSLVYR
ncbi:MAG: DNA translocase FtsK, partial [Gemmatimonas sp.]